MTLGAPTLLTSGQSNTAGSSVATASVTPAANRVVFVACVNLDSGAVPTGVSGCNLTWTKVVDQVFSDCGLALYWGVGASPSSGVITISFAASQIRFRWAVHQWGTDVDTTTPALQNKVATGTATNATATLAAGVTAGNALYGTAGIRGYEAMTQGSGFVLLTNDDPGNQPTLLTEWEASPADATGTASWTSSIAYAFILAEVKAAAAAGEPSQPNFVSQNASLAVW